MGIEGDRRGGRATKPELRERPGPEFRAEVNVSTATAILHKKGDPFQVLVGNRAGCQKPVLPGGKQETADFAGGSAEEAPGLSTVIREIIEETGGEVCEIRHIGTATDPGRDIRSTPVRKLRGVVLSGELGELKDEDLVLAHYGCPDEIYVGEFDIALGNTEELKDLHFMDIRNLKPGDLSRGHDVILLWYRDMLDRNLDRLPSDALVNFGVELEMLVRGT